VQTARHHIESLDVFRGLTIASMILVNNPGEWAVTYPTLLHEAWNGCTFADVVFPSFIFIVGVATSFAFARRVREGHPARAIVWRIVRRTLLLIALGLVLNWASPPTETHAFRFPGVLQRIALVYAVTATLVLWTRVRGRIVAIVVLLVAHTACLLWAPFGSHGPGLLEPGMNFSVWVDRTILGPHILSRAGDPEGLFGTVSAVVSALLGTLAARWLRSSPEPRRRFLGLFGGGLLLILLGFGCERVIPLNKNLWTASYVLLTAGLAAAGLALCYLIVDVANARKWARPFLWLGLNPLAIYFLAELVGHVRDWPITVNGDDWTVQSWLFWQVFEPPLGNYLSDPAISLVVGLLTVAVWIAVAGLLYRRNIRIVV
jgi:predicted acyltransferase